MEVEQQPRKAQIKDMLARMGIAMAPPDHPIYKQWPLVVVCGQDVQQTGEGSPR